MAFEGNGGSEGMSVPPHREVPHYHGNTVRILFLAVAIVLIVAQSTGADLPLATVSTVIFAALFVIAAGITNPKLAWIHWVNASLALIGTIVFGSTAIEQYRLGGVRLFDSSFIYIEALALLSLVALYFATRTIRGVHVDHLH